MNELIKNLSRNIKW